MAATLTDSYTDTSGLALTSHVADTGQAYTKHPAAGYVGAQAFAISSGGRARRNATAGTDLTISAATFATAELDIAAEFRVVSAAGHNGIAFRFSPTADEGLFLRLNFSTLSWELFSSSAEATYGAAIATAGQAVSAGATHSVVVTLRGGNVKVAVNGTPNVISLDDPNAARHTDAGRFGLRSGSTMTDATGIHIDNVSVTEIVPGGGGETLLLGVG